jgi:hypothetical protein
MQATAVAGMKPGGGLQPPLSRMPIAARECGLTIDRIDRTVVTLEFPTEAGVSPERMEGQRDVALAVAAALTRTAVMVVLASLAILVLLPAVIAAQAAAL